MRGNIIALNSHRPAEFKSGRVEVDSPDADFRRLAAAAAALSTQLTATGNRINLETDATDVVTAKKEYARAKTAYELALFQSLFAKTLERLATEDIDPEFMNALASSLVGVFDDAKANGAVPPPRQSDTKTEAAKPETNESEDQDA